MAATLTEQQANYRGLKTITDNGDGTGSLNTTGGTGGGGSTTVSSITAGETHIGEVGGNSEIISVTPTITAAAYAAGNSVGGIQTLTGAMRISGGKGVLQSLFIVDKSNQKPPLDILIFNQNPSNGTYADKTALSLNATDQPFLVRRISVAATDYVTVGGVSIADLSPGGRVLKAIGSANLFALISTSGTPTFASTSDLTINFGILRD